MSFNNISAGVIAACVLAVLPSVSEAYFTTGQSAKALNSTAAVFSIEYSFGLEDHDIYLPVLAQRGLTDTTEKKVGYTFRENEDEVQSQGTATGVVVSDAPIVDGMYKIAKGTAQKMTLVVLLLTDADEFEDDYALQVETLPYYVDRGEAALQKLQLNPSELQYYVTKEIELNTGNYQ